MRRALWGSTSVLLAALLLWQLLQWVLALHALHPSAQAVSAQLGPALLLKTALLALNALLLWGSYRSWRGV